MTDLAGKLDPTGLTPHVGLRRIQVLVNPRSGGVGPKAGAECERLLAPFGLDAQVVEAEGARLGAAIQAALDSKPDLLVILAGDGTARSAAALAGPDGPLLAPLPGGTMNMLPRALYGTVDWKLALKLALTEGHERTVAGGEVDGRPFYVAAMLGSPALWAPAREAMRTGKLRLAWLYARQATRRAFQGKLRFRLDGGERRRAAALALLSPMISKAKIEADALEVAVMTFDNATAALSLAARTLVADWRADPTIETATARHIEVSARGRIPAILDGESVHLGREVEIVFRDVAFRALAPRLEASALLASARNVA
jgi:diacylglycerol kinase family enzyme